MIDSQRNGRLESARRALELIFLQIGDTQIEEQIPLFKTQVDRATVLGNLFSGHAEHPVGETEMIMRERVERPTGDQFAMKLNGPGIILDAQEIVGGNVTDLILLQILGHCDPILSREIHYRGENREHES